MPAFQCSANWERIFRTGTSAFQLALFHSSWRKLLFYREKITRSMRCVLGKLERFSRLRPARALPAFRFPNMQKHLHVYVVFCMLRKWLYLL